MNILYKSRYDKLITAYKNNPKDGFVEKHHIIPRCMGGTDDIENLILLPTRAHFIAHYLLYKAYPENTRLAHAFAMMGVCNGYQHRSSKLYSQSKLARSKALKGKPRPEWVREKMRRPKNCKTNYKKPKTAAHSANIAASLKGKKKSALAVANSIKGKKAYYAKIKNECEARANSYRDRFISSNLSRKEFYLECSDISASTLNRYLRGL